MPVRSNRGSFVQDNLVVFWFSFPVQYRGTVVPNGGRATLTPPIHYGSPDVRLAGATSTFVTWLGAFARLPVPFLLQSRDLPSASTAISHAGNVDPSSVSSTGAFVGPAESVGSGRAVAVGSGVGSGAVVGSAVAVGSRTWVEPVMGVGPAVEVGSAVCATVGVGSGAGVAVDSGVGMAVGSGVGVDSPLLGGFTGSSVYETRA